MSVIHTLLNNGIEKTLAEWGVEHTSRTLRIQAVDEVSFLEPCARADDDPLFAPKSDIQLFREVNGVKVKCFDGRVLTVKPDVSGETEGRIYTITGPWQRLENHVFKQIWKSYTGDPDNLAEVRVSHVLLGTKVVIDQLVRQHARDQIKEVLDYAILCGVPIQYDLAAIPEIFLPTLELRDKNCAEAIREQLRWLPDLILRWDYEVTPPKLIFTKRGLTAPVMIPAFGGILAKWTLEELYAQQRPAVVIRYELTNTDDGLNWKQHATDKVPANATGDEEGAMMMTIDLQGFSRTTSSAWLATEPIESANVNWWKARVNWLNDAEIESIEMGAPNRSGELGLPNEITEGSFPPWLTDQGKSYEQETFSVAVKVMFKNGSKREEMLSVDVNATDAATREYTNLDSYDPGESVPVGLAQELYNAVSRREFMGSGTLVEQDCSGVLLAGYTFSLTGSRPEYVNMLVSEITEDIDSGTTSFQFGPPAYLGAADLVALLQANRTRFVYTFGTQRATGKAGLDNRIDLPKLMAKRNTAGGTKNHEVVSIRTQTDNRDAGSILLDASKTVVGGNLREITIREMNVCIQNSDGTTTTKKVLGAFSEPY